jgi:hypothetical protein
VYSFFVVVTSLINKISSWDSLWAETKLGLIAGFKSIASQEQLGLDGGGTHPTNNFKDSPQAALL